MCLAMSTPATPFLESKSRLEKLENNMLFQRGRLEKLEDIF